jgi:hypothetical protein
MPLSLGSRRCSPYDVNGNTTCYDVDASGQQPARAFIYDRENERPDLGSNYDPVFVGFGNQCSADCLASCLSRC